MRRSRMSPENRPSKPPPGMRGGNAGAGARGRERGTKCERGPGGRSRRQNPPPKAWGRMWGAGLGRSTGPECVGRSARPTQGGMRGAGARGPGCEGRNTGPERGDRSLSPERESLLPKSALQIRHPKRGAECGGRSGSEREPGCVGRSARPGARAGCGGRCARTGVRARSARAVPPGTRGRSVGPEDEPGCVGRSARPGAGAGARGPGCEGRNTGPERGDRSLSPERESLLPKSALQIRHPKRGAECGGRSGSERETGVHRPEHGTGVRAGVRRQECGDRSARTRCEDQMRGPERENQSASRGAGAEARGRVRGPGCGAGCGLRT